MDYQAAVTEARTLVRRSEEDQWRLAELTFEQCVSRGRAQTAWADDVGLHPSYVSRLCQVWGRWGSVTTPQKPKFSAAYVEIAPSSARQPVISNMPVEQKARIAQELMRDPEIARPVMEDPQARTSTAKAFRDHSADEIERAEQNYRREHTESVSNAAYISVYHRIVRSARILIEALDELPEANLSIEQRDNLRGLLEHVEQPIAAIREHLSGGAASIDDELRELLARESR